MKDCVGRAMPGDGAGHIAPNRTIQVRGILLYLLGHSAIPLWITDFIPLKAVLALASTSICLGRMTSKRDRLTALWWAVHHYFITPQHFSSAAKFSIPPRVSCNINTSVWLTCALHVLQTVQQNQRLQALRPLWCQQAGEPTLSNEDTLWLRAELTAPWGLKKMASDLIKCLGS